ncbi:MAG: bifunctional 5,10-methylenetetrahydrofolate dehydrogenase/5,10-methenyltetrahydrofolate cyclohydrolase [Nitrospirae bacterium]|nr:MAG: bifunctional 5,10-methylenetetrahydrofolate dehydrogenase/5,10-methenyltetrahydrofolate cyclohydrolase [Nitrospirota bacterium]
MPKIMDGKKLAEDIKNAVRKEVLKLNERGFDVGLSVVLAGDDPASEQYFLAITKASKHVGITVYRHKLSGAVSTNELLNTVQSLNTDERVNGIMLFLPLPKRINARRIINSIAPEKDVDGLGAISIGRLAAEESTFQLFKGNEAEGLASRKLLPYMSSFIPCTPYGVIRFLEYYGVELKGKHVVVISKSLAVGKPLSLMLLAKEATVTVCHRETKNLPELTKQADILCTATGRPGLIKGDMVKDGVVIVDIGIKVLPDGRIVGDIAFDSVKDKVSLITPVPGGVGPVTIAMLLENTMMSAKRSELLKSPLMM